MLQFIFSQILFILMIIVTVLSKFNIEIINLALIKKNLILITGFSIFLALVMIINIISSLTRLMACSSPVLIAEEKSKLISSILSIVTIILVILIIY